tara:strand:+ start:89 stop:751 length:663 start_codon:yes stop_codon:yes gene_type:complete
VNNFIEIYEGAIPKRICEYFVDFFEKQDKLNNTFVGTTGSRTYTDIKQCTDLNLRFPKVDAQNKVSFTTAEHVSILNEYDTIVNSHFTSYLQYYHPGPNGKLSKRWYGEFYEGYRNHPLMHRYIPPDEGYHGWHEDWDNRSFRTGQRKLVGMVYLNDVFEGGETEFLHQQIKIKPVEGTLVVWPAYFTHMHKGHKPISNTKYIVNKWCIPKKPGMPTQYD